MFFILIQLHGRKYTQKPNAKQANLFSRSPQMNSFMNKFAAMLNMFLFQ